jgi:anti-sigma factor RsiW
MTARLVDDDLLQRFHDGDTTDAESGDVRKKLTESAEDRRALQRLEKLSALFAEVAKEDVDAASAELEGLYARVRDKTSAAPKSNVVEMKPRKLARIYAPVAALAAAAALLIAYVSMPGVWGTSQGDGDHTTANDQHVNVHVVQPPLVGSRVVEEDFGDGAGTVFSVSGENGAQVAVVWISDDDEPAAP